MGGRDLGDGQVGRLEGWEGLVLYCAVWENRPG